VQCPTSTITHPSTVAGVNNNAEPTYSGPTTLTLNSRGFFAPTAKRETARSNASRSPAVVTATRTMGDGTQTYMFSFGPLSGIVDIANGKPGQRKFPNLFNTPFTGLLGAWRSGHDRSRHVHPTTVPSARSPIWDNGSVIDGHVDPRQAMDVGVMNGNIPAPMMAIDEGRRVSS